MSSSSSPSPSPSPSPFLSTSPIIDLYNDSNSPISTQPSPSTSIFSRRNGIDQLPIPTALLVSQFVQTTFLTQEELKKMAAYKAVEFVKSDMVLGLGTGSIAKHAIDRIFELLKTGQLKNIVGIPTSKKTHEQARKLGIPLSDLNSHLIIDMAIDGVDEVDPEMNLVKGRGRSLLREKMVESASKKFIVIVDETKLVDYVGGSGLEIYSSEVRN